MNQQRQIITAIGRRSYPLPQLPPSSADCFTTQHGSASSPDIQSLMVGTYANGLIVQGNKIQTTRR